MNHYGMIGTNVAYWTWLWRNSAKTRPAMLAAQTIGIVFFYQFVVKQFNRMSF